MRRQCRNCAMYVLQYYDGKSQGVGRCLHVAFIKAGFAQPPEIPGQRPEEIRHHWSLERVHLEEAQALREGGFFYLDHIDVKTFRGRVCGHWRSPTGYLQDTLDYYGDTLDHVASFPGLSQPLRDWISAGLPKEEVYYERLNRMQVLDFRLPEVPEKFLGYDTCLTCRFYDPEVGPDLVPLPYKGRCRQMKPAGDMFSLLGDDEDPVVYSMMGCEYHQVSDGIDAVNAPQELPNRLMVFVETNFLDLTLAELASIYRFPTVSRLKAVDDAEYADLMGTDLVRTLRNRHRQIDYNSFASDFGVQSVAEFFARGVSKGTKEHAATWGPFQGYKGSDDALFASLDDPNASDEVQTMREFGSSLSLPGAGGGS